MIFNTNSRMVDGMCIQSVKATRCKMPKRKANSGDSGPDSKYACFRGQTSAEKCVCSETPIADISQIVCEKHPDHLKFHPYEKLTMAALPEQMKYQQYMYFIDYLADLTVKVVTSIVTDDRPKFRLRTGTEYPHSKTTNKVYRVATGTVVKASAKDANDGSKFYELIVITARHAVWNEAELGGTEIELSFHRAPQKNYTLIADSKSEYSVINMDVCSMSFSTCDDELGTRLADCCDHFWRAAAKLKELPFNDGSSGPDDGESFLAIVSHPHGCEKCVTFGKVANSLLYLTESGTAALYLLALHLSFSPTQKSDKDMCIAHTAPTCQGCSGALIVYYCRSDDCLKICTHEGHRTGDGLNHSGSPEYITEQCLGLQDERSSWVIKRRRYSNHINEEEAKRFNLANDRTFHEEVDYAFMRSDDKKLREILQRRYGPQIEEQVSELIQESTEFLGAVVAKDEEKLAKFKIPFIEKLLGQSPKQLEKQSGLISRQFLSYKLESLLQDVDHVKDDKKT